MRSIVECPEEPVAWVSTSKRRRIAMGVTILLVVATASCGGSTPGVQSAAPSQVVTPTETAPPSQQPPTQVKVPDLVGLDSPAAVRKLANTGFVLGNLTQSFSHRPPGTILHLSVHAGSKVEEGATISLVVAEPYPKVPNVVGLHVQSATSKLEAAGYKVTITRQTSGQSAGRVIATRPGAGSELLPGKTVQLVVAKA